MNENELRKWSTTGPNDSILRPPLEKSISPRTADVRTILLLKKEHSSICGNVNSKWMFWLLD